MDSVETVAVVVGSAILVAMLAFAGRRSWLDRRETERGFEQRKPSRAISA